MTAKTSNRRVPIGPKLQRGDVAERGDAKARGSGHVPDGDVRLTANIRGDLHQRLRIRAIKERTTVGELIERWIEGWRS